jgi:murein DD-endopeptidase MepM/ murein hydrolase activator NlpD
MIFPDHPPFWLPATSPRRTRDYHSIRPDRRNIRQRTSLIVGTKSKETQLKRSPPHIYRKGSWAGIVAVGAAVAFVAYESMPTFDLVPQSSNTVQSISKTALSRSSYPPLCTSMAEPLCSLSSDSLSRVWPKPAKLEEPKQPVTRQEAREHPATLLPPDIPEGKFVEINGISIRIPDGDPISPVGWRKLFGYIKFHAGTDFPKPVGTPVAAPGEEKGVVLEEGWVDGYGKMVAILYRKPKSPDKCLIVYLAHLSEILVKKKQEITFGTIVGYSGATGRITGPNLHVETRPCPENFDPQRYVITPGTPENVFDPRRYPRISRFRHAALD